MRTTRRSAAAVDRHPITAEVNEPDDSAASGLGTASLCAVAASLATAATYAVSKFAKNFSRSEAAFFACIVAVWMVLFAFLIGLPSSGDNEIPAIVLEANTESSIGYGDYLWGAFTIPMATLNSARDAILSIPDMLRSFESVNNEGGRGAGGDDVVKVSDEGTISVDYDKLAGQLLDNHNFRKAIVRAAEAKMVRVRDEVMQQADKRLEEVRQEVRVAAANKDRRIATIEDRLIDIKNGHKAATEEASKCCGRLEETALKKRVNEAVSEYLGNVTTSSSERDAELRFWLEDNFLNKEDMQSQLKKVIICLAVSG